ncbi:alpha/beta hydrolase [Pseudodonghicola flavimaris]|uniref:Alpha/beta hydrolase n=1 Tax=Pseudodonghicola flavimaris TaxID=3050036 RepID=A0ABT7F2B1_9RHOB|nr:alpha/beta hydrolase [Pseudodonghicola flavimaris]MDK3018745.1 alpha/beta hydrolase [Pseudodonghicola flavimaris]
MSDPVFRDYSQAALDRQYDQSKWSRRPPAAYAAEYRARTDAAKAALGAPTAYAYGDSPAETLDVYRAAASEAPVHVFIHGGAWRSMSKADSGFAAELFVSRGIHFVALDFGLLPAVDLREMVVQTRRGLAWVYRNAARFGGNPERIFVSGHSSGGHLAACVAVTDWAGAFGLPADLLKGALCCSGGYDLGPVQLSARNDYMQLDDAMVAELSPNRHLDRLGCPLALAVGDAESDDFTRQSVAMAAAGGLPLHVGRNMDHFEISFTLGDAGGLLADLALRQIAGA